MSEHNEQAKAILARQRLLKANNVQRRRYEKMADEVINRAQAKQRDNLNHKKQVIYNQHVEKAMGAELP